MVEHIGNMQKYEEENKNPLELPLRCLLLHLSLYLPTFPGAHLPKERHPCTCELSRQGAGRV